MAQSFAKIVVDGFESGQTDFAALLERSQPAVQGLVYALVDGLVRAETDARAGHYWSVTVVGESDAAGSGSIQERRQQEYEASRNRLFSAANWLFDAVCQGIKDAGQPPPASVDTTTNLGFCYVIQGAADLVHPNPTSQAQRMENRRVKLMVMTFVPETPFT